MATICVVTEVDEKQGANLGEVAVQSKSEMHERQKPGD